MKKLLKFIPLLVLPLTLTACPLLEKMGGSGEQTQTETTTSKYPTSVTISGDNSVLAGETIQLTATYTPSDVTNKTVSWTSSNEAVARVDQRGKVTGRKAGNATITASMKGENNTTVTATHAVTVIAPDPTGILLDASSITLAYGKTRQLNASFTPNGASSQVNWSSNNTSVATVSSSGLVTAKSVTGTATITATSVTGGYTATCTVNVKEVTGILTGSMT